MLEYNDELGLAWPSYALVHDKLNRLEVEDKGDIMGSCEGCVWVDEVEYWSLCQICIRFERVIMDRYEPVDKQMDSDTTGLIGAVSIDKPEEPIKIREGPSSVLNEPGY